MSLGWLGPCRDPESLSDSPWGGSVQPCGCPLSREVPWGQHQSCHRCTCSGTREPAAAGLSTCVTRHSGRVTGRSRAGGVPVSTGRLRRGPRCRIPRGRAEWGSPDPAGVRIGMCCVTGDSGFFPAQAPPQGTREPGCPFPDFKTEFFLPGACYWWQPEGSASLFCSPPPLHPRAWTRPLRK